MHRFKSVRFWLYPLATIVLVVLGFLLYSGAKFGASTVSLWWNEEEEETPTRKTSKSKNSAPTTLTKVLIPWFDGFTPCDPTFDFTFELDTQGDPIFMKFPGVKKLVPYSGKGQLDLEDPANPIQRLSGPVHITSQDPQKQARVRIWKVIYIRA